MFGNLVVVSIDYGRYYYWQFMWYALRHRTLDGKWTKFGLIENRKLYFIGSETFVFQRTFFK